MIKKIVSVAFVAAVLSVGGYHHIQNQKERSLSRLALENIEALAGLEIEPRNWYCCGSDGTCYINWGEMYKVVGDFRVTPC